MAKPNVDLEKCIGCGACASLCDEVFTLEDSTGKIKVKDADYEKNAECIKEAVDSCPANAIEL